MNGTVNYSEDLKGKYGEEHWKAKFEKEFGTTILKYSPKNESYASKYHRHKLVDITGVNKYRLDYDVILRLHNKYKMDVFWNMPEHHDSLIEDGYVSHDDIVYYAIENNNPDILSGFNIEYSPHHADYACKNNKIIFLDFFESLPKKTLPTFNGADYATLKNFVDILRWCKNREVYPTVSCVNYAAENGYMDIIKLISDKVLPDGVGAYYVRESGDKEMYDYITSFGVKPKIKLIPSSY